MSDKLLKDQIGQSGGGSGDTQGKSHFDEPKLTFIEPKLTKHGDATKITGTNGFFGTFTPCK